MSDPENCVPNVGGREFGAKFGTRFCRSLLTIPGFFAETSNLSQVARLFGGFPLLGICQLSLWGQPLVSGVRGGQGGRAVYLFLLSISSDLFRRSC